MIRCFFNHHVWRCFLIRWWWQTCLSGKSSSGHLRWKEIAGTKLNRFVFSPVSFSVCRYWPEMLSQLTYLSRLQYTCKYVPTCFITEVDAFVLTKHVDFAETKSKAFRHVWWLASLARLLVACCVAMIQNCASLWCSYASLFSWGHNPRLERTRSDGSLSSAVPSTFFVRPGPQALVGGRERWAAATSRCSHTIRVYNQKIDISQQEYKREHQGNPIIWDRATDFIPLRHIAALSFPSPPTSVACQVRPFIFFGEMANHLGWGAPKHTPLMTYLYMLVSIRFVSFFFLVHMEMGLRHPTLRHTQTRYKVYVSRLLLRSYDFKRKWWCTMALPSATVHLSSLLPNWIYDNLRPAVPVTPVPPDLLLWANRPFSGRTDFSK